LRRCGPSGIPAKRGFDQILIGAPYSELGTLRRNSDARQKRTWSDILELSEIQFRILLGTSYRLKANGIIVYCVGTLMLESNKDVIQESLAVHRGSKIDLEIESTSWGNDFLGENGFFISDPVRHNTDGFFAMRLRKMK
jgi:16S rRNA (cytosine967-C5)-methyltransferase